MQSRAAREVPPEAAKPAGPARPRRPGSRPRGAPLAALQRSVGNRATLGLIHRQAALAPGVRDAKLILARTLFDAAVARLPELASLAAQVQGLSMQQVPGGQQEGAAAVATTLAGMLEATGAQLDQGIAFYREAGGALADIEALLRMRAHLGTALFHTRLVAARVPNAGVQLPVFLARAMAEAGIYRADEAGRLATAASATQGPPTEQEHLQRVARDQRL